MWTSDEDLSENKGDEQKTANFWWCIPRSPVVPPDSSSNVGSQQLSTSLPFSTSDYLPLLPSIGATKFSMCAKSCRVGGRYYKRTTGPVRPWVLSFLCLRIVRLYRKKKAGFGCSTWGLPRPSETLGHPRFHVGHASVQWASSTPWGRMHWRSNCCCCCYLKGSSFWTHNSYRSVLELIALRLQTILLATVTGESNHHLSVISLMGTTKRMVRNVLPVPEEHAHRGTRYYPNLKVWILKIRYFSWKRCK